MQVTLVIQGHQSPTVVAVLLPDLLAQGEQEGGGGGGGATAASQEWVGEEYRGGEVYYCTLHQSGQQDHYMAGHTCCRYGLAAFLQAGWYEQQGQDNHMEK